MNEEEEEAPHVRRNRLARERPAARSKEQCAVDASSNAQIALENATCVNSWTLLHPNRQQETHNADCQAHQG